MARILIADDEAPMRDLMALACEMDGHTVTKAIDAPSAISAYAVFRPDLVLLDLSMPGGGGVAVLGHLRFAGAGNLCPVIIVSGILDTLPKHELEGLGASAIVSKPFSIASLRQTIREVLKTGGVGPGA